MIESVPVIITLSSTAYIYTIRSYQLSEIKYPPFINSFVSVKKKRKFFAVSGLDKFNTESNKVESTLTPEIGVIACSFVLLPK